MGAPVIGLALGGLGLGAQVYGLISGASANAEAQEQQAAIKNAQADELLARQKINEQIMNEQYEESALQTGMASRGIATTGVGLKLKMHEALVRNIELNRREADFKAKMLRMGADVDMNLAGSYRSAGYINAAGSILSTGGRVAKYYAGGQKDTDLWSIAGG